jgi:hypothetical protein
MPNYRIQGSSYFNVGDAFSALDIAFGSLSNRVVALEQTPGLGLPVGTGSGLRPG